MCHGQISASGLQLCARATAYQVYAYLQRRDHFARFELAGSSGIDANAGDHGDADADDNTESTDVVHRWSIPMKMLLGVLGGASAMADDQLMRMELGGGKLALM